MTTNFRDFLRRAIAQGGWIPFILFCPLAAEDPPKDDLILEPFAIADRTHVILGRPTDRSVTLHVFAPDDGELVVEHGSAPSALDRRSALVPVRQGNPVVLVLDGLTPDAVWHYRLAMRQGKGDFIAGRIFSFHTRRAIDSAFRFLIEADPHLDGNSSIPLFTNVLGRMASEQADFFIDLGDVFMCEKLRPQTRELVVLRHLIFRPFFEIVAAASPLFMVLGNHEGEFGYNDRKVDASLPTWAFEARSTWYPNPTGDLLKSGITQGSGFQNYYAWEWGSALFVVLDMYRTTPKKPGRAGDNWLYTLGETQYRWMRRTLETSKAAFKFVFAHQLVGGSAEGSRGGVEFAQLYEWGGQNADGSEGFDEKRPGWGKSIHRILVDTGVNAFFHGHDHLYVKQELDGVVYQACPQPSAKNTQYPQYAAEYGYKSGTIIGNSGYLRLDVAKDGVEVKYMRLSSGRGRDAAFSWTTADQYLMPRRSR